MEYKFSSTIKCQACIEKVKPILDANKSIQKWEVDLLSPQRILSIESLHLEVELLKEELKKIGYTIQ
jgi:copper chaperone